LSRIDLPSKSLRQPRIQLRPRRHAVQAEIAAQIELQRGGQRAAQRRIQRIDRRLAGLQRLRGEDLAIDSPALVDRLTFTRKSKAP
jgi:hypothetical protein